MLEMAGLEDISQRIPAPGNPKSLRRLTDIRCFMTQRLHQPQHAILADRRADQHGADQSFTQFAGKIVEDGIGRRHDVLEQLLHQGVVMVGEFLQHREACFLLAIEIAAIQRDDFRCLVLAIDKGALQGEINEAGDEIAVPDRNLPQYQRHTRSRLQRGQGFAYAFVSAIYLVEEQEARNAQVFKLAQDELQLRQLALIGLANHHGSIDRRQRRAHILREFDRAGAIDERITVAHEASRHGGETHPHLVCACFGTCIAGARAGLDTPGLRDRSRTREDRLKQCGFSALERAHQCDASRTALGAWGTSQVLSHTPPPDLELGP